MQLRWFHIRGVCIAPGCVYRSSSAKRGMGIPGDHVNRVETYHHPLELAVVRELQSRVRLPTDEGTVQSPAPGAIGWGKGKSEGILA